MTEKHELTPVQVKKILDIAEQESPFDRTAIETIITLGLKRAAVLGQNDPRSSPTPGMLIENLTKNGVYLVEPRKKGRVFKPIPPELRARIDLIVDKRTKGRIFERTTGWIWYRLERYRKLAGIDFTVNANSLHDFHETYEYAIPQILKNPHILEPQSEAQTPREMLNKTYQTIMESLQSELLNRIKKGSPKFFEEIVADFLVASGYGTKESIQILGRPGDRGIDGIVKSDPLGFEETAFQAKRWGPTVGSPEVAEFVGNLERRRAKRGVMITTSGFSKDAHQFAKDIGSKLVLADGQRLTSMMIQFNVGVVPDESYTLKKIDEKYFERSTK